MASVWPSGFVRIPAEPWVRQPIESLAVKYDSVENHGWYANLDVSVEKLSGVLREDAILMDYSGGTGILTDRLLRRSPELRAGIVIVDSSPKFLRLAVEKLGGDERVAFRLIQYLKEARRLQYPDEVLDPSLVARGLDAVASTNAIHLYYDLEDTLAAWRRVLRTGGRIHVQSGNVRNPAARPGELIIDETVEAVHRAAVEIVSEDPSFANARAVLANPSRREAYEALRQKYFLPVRPLEHYLRAFEQAGFRILEVQGCAIPVQVGDWLEFLGAYVEGILGWVGGVEKIEGRPPAAPADRDRRRLLELAVARVFGGRPAFHAYWTYLDAEAR